VRGGSRVYAAPRGYAPRGYSSRGYSSRGYYARPYYSRPYYARPYYSFRPHVNLGLGLWLGYPVAYPYYYDSPYVGVSPYADPYGDPYAYGAAPSYSAPGYETAPSYGEPGYAPPAYGAVQPSAPSVEPRGSAQSDRGGISFEITPDNAQVFVDGNYAGTAGEFGPNARPLDLSGGQHHVEVRASGYRTISFDADVRPGQVLPYQGTLQRN
jgi:hypothetical protein